jgi:hypothetical protein
MDIHNTATMDPKEGLLIIQAMSRPLPVATPPILLLVLLVVMMGEYMFNGYLTFCFIMDIRNTAASLKK